MCKSKNNQLSKSKNESYNFFKMIKLRGNKATNNHGATWSHGPFD